MQGQLGLYVSGSGEVSSFTANLTLYKKNWNTLYNHIIWMKRYKELKKPNSLDPRKYPRCATSTLIEKNGKQLMVINTHLAWGPTPDDALYKRNQAEKLYKFMKTHVTIPFILAGDFNLNPHTIIVSRFSLLGNNLTKKFRVTNTLNPKTHYAKHLFPSGLPVDYIISDKRLVVKKFCVEESVNLSDHFGLIAEFKY
jgi:endonuclease/exonuclease/phosphatase family metal-dependent hydrolase